MSDIVSPLRNSIFGAFTDAFGAADRTEGKDMQWSVLPDPSMAPINVLVNGSTYQPVLWVFDPHNRSFGVHSEIVTHADAIPRLIRMINERLKAASQLPR